jgi:hypothetical protein
LSAGAIAFFVLVATVEAWPRDLDKAFAVTCGVTALVWELLSEGGRWVIPVLNFSADLNAFALFGVLRWGGFALGIGGIVCTVMIEVEGREPVRWVEWIISTRRARRGLGRREFMIEKKIYSVATRLLKPRMIVGSFTPPNAALWHPPHLQRAVRLSCQKIAPELAKVLTSRKDVAGAMQYLFSRVATELYTWEESETVVAEGGFDSSGRDCFPDVTYVRQCSIPSVPDRYAASQELRELLFENVPMIKLRR